MLPRKDLYQRYIYLEVILIAEMEYKLFLVRASEKKIVSIQKVDLAKEFLSKILKSDKSANINMMYREN